MLTSRRIEFVARVLRLMAATLLPVLPSSAAVAQDRIPARMLGPREAAGTETFSQVRGFRELSDGRVLITDQRERKIVLLDLARRTATRVGREGPGPGEFQLATDLVALPGDTTLLFDVGRGSEVMSVITPGGEIDGTMRIPEGVRFSYLFGDDTLGRAWVLQPRFRLANAPPADSQPVVRIDFRRGRADTAFFIRAIPRNPAAPNPYNPRHEWAVGPDGRAAILDVDRYQVMWITPDGRRSVGAPIPYERLPVTARDQEEFRELARRVSGLGTGGMARVGGAAPGAPPAMGFPSHKPPFFGNDAAKIAPNGELWVRRSQPAGATAPLHDIIDAEGLRVATITLPAKTQLLALGARGVYLARYDDDDLIHIERYRYP